MTSNAFDYMEIIPFVEVYIHVVHFLFLDLSQKDCGFGKVFDLFRDVSCNYEDKACVCREYLVHYGV